ncbi:MAG: flagellar biosynthesis protein FlhB [Alphaproteobacteria bacterium RIFOXYD12_FULL_60_8]|nr:MAG: flagellar biosynthesis protein FlhB [Alphaproteobacteria bacterium RIFOXYD12_FULL_60_8]
MAEEDQDSKTEDASDRKLHRAREEGGVPQSQEVKAVIGLMGAAMVVGIFSPGIANDLKILLIPFLSEVHAMPADFEHLRFLVADVFTKAALTIALPMGLIFLVSVMASVMQTGLMWTPKKLALDITKFSMIKGAKRLMSTRSLVEFIKGIVKLVVVGLVMWMVAVPQMGVIVNMATMSLEATLGEIKYLVMLLLIVVISVMVVLAVADFTYQFFTFMKEQRMTKQEVKDEAKSSDGDPHVKQRIAQLRKERARQRMMAAVPKADVVVTNPTHYAIALEYKHELMDAPRLVAKGVDSLAQKIREVAELNDVPIVENPPLARALYATVELDQEVPPEHYKAVAEVIGYVMRLKGKVIR